MTRFLLLYRGPPTPPDASHEGWSEWFTKIGDALVDLGSPMTNGFVLGSDRSTRDDAASLNGYSIIQAEDRGKALELIDDHLDGQAYGAAQCGPRCAEPVVSGEEGAAPARTFGVCPARDPTRPPARAGSSAGP